MSRPEKMILTCVRWLQRAAGILLIAMMLLSCLDVVGNSIGHPILGSVELVSLMAALLLAFSLPAAHVHKAHIGIDLIRGKMPPRMRRINDTVVNLVTAVFFVVVSWQCLLYAQELRTTGEVSTTLELPLHFILQAIALSCFILSLTMFKDVVQLLRGGDRHE